MPRYENVDEQSKILIDNLINYDKRKKLESLLFEEKSLANKSAMQDIFKKQQENKLMTDIFSVPKTNAILALNQQQDIPVSDLISGKLDTRQSGIDLAKNQALKDQLEYGNSTVGQFKDNAIATAKENTGNELLSPNEAEMLDVPYGTTKLQAKGKIPKNPRLEGLQAERERRSEERKKDNTNKILQLFNSDPSVKKSQQSLDAAVTIRDLADSNNPIAASAIPTYSARMSGEVGNLSEPDKRPFGGSQAIVKRLDAIWEQAKSGQLTADNKQYILALTKIVEKRANENIVNLAKKRAKQYSKTKGNPSEQELLSTFAPDYISDSGNLTPEEQNELAQLEKELGK